MPDKLTGNLDSAYFTLSARHFVNEFTRPGLRTPMSELAHMRVASSCLHEPVEPSAYD
jgi:hypothetical protein